MGEVEFKLSLFIFYISRPFKESGGYDRGEWLLFSLTIFMEVSLNVESFSLRWKLVFLMQP